MKELREIIAGGFSLLSGTILVTFSILAPYAAYSGSMYEYAQRKMKLPLILGIIIMAVGVMLLAKGLLTKKAEDDDKGN